MKLKFETMVSDLEGQVVEAFDSQYKKSGPLSFFSSIGDEVASLELTAPIIPQIKMLETMELAFETHKEQYETTVAIHDATWKGKTQFALGECSLCFVSLLPAKSGNIKVKFMKDAIDETALKIFRNIEDLPETHFQETKVSARKSMNFSQLEQEIQEVSTMEIQLEEVRHLKTVPVKTTSAGLLEYYKTREVGLGFPHKIQAKVEIIEKFMKAAISENVYNVHIKPFKEQLAAITEIEQRTATIELMKQAVVAHKSELAKQQTTFKDLIKGTIPFGQVGKSLEAREKICEKETIISGMEELIGSFASETLQSILVAGGQHHHDSPTDSSS